MVLVDVVFIIEFFMKFYQPNFRTNEDPILRKSFLHDDVKLEILLLENQLPLFILNDLFNLAKTISRQPNIDLHQETTFCIKKLSLGFGLNQYWTKTALIRQVIGKWSCKVKCNWKWSKYEVYMMSLLWSSGVLRNREEIGVDEGDGHFLTAGFGFEFGGKSWPQPLILKEKKCCFLTTNLWKNMIFHLVQQWV